ncbi:MAG: hypothetical protein H6739_40865, partial [Alphaproteobacteria bacterium]|nr:hypothetical protein [Alphaproteobacteria bacterium]
RRLALLLLALVACKNDRADDSAEPVPLCYADEVPETATVRPGWQDDGSLITPGGRLVVPAGDTVRFDDMPIDVEAHPTLPVAYVTLVGRSDRWLAVVDLESLETVQLLARDDNHRGLALSPDGSRLYAAGGAGDTLDVFEVDGAGLLTELTRVPVGGTAVGVALSEDGGTAWTGAYYEGFVAEVDTASLTVTRTLTGSTDVWDLAHLPGRGQLYASDLAGDGVAVFDVTSGAEVAVVSLNTSPAGLAVTEDEATVFAAVSNGDVVAAIDADSASVRAEAGVTEGVLLDPDGAPLGNSNLTAVHLSGGQLFVTRGADNAVSVLDPDTLEPLGSFPVAMYPVAMATAADGRLIVAEYKGYVGADTNNWNGSISVVDVNALDLVDTSADVAALYESPTDRYPFECDGMFPIPANDRVPSPIEHVVLIVKENKTFDCLFGDLGGTLDVDADPEELRWPAELTPNQRALIAQFNVSDSFFVDALESDSGHLMLTSTHLTHYVEWMWMETAHSGGSTGWPVTDAATPTVGNFFTHLLDQGRSLQVYGEIVGMFETSASGELVFDHSDTDYPGGPFVNYAITDEEKALHIAEAVAEDGLADFTYISLPNDHTAGTDGEYPSPESMVADNDRATGLVVEAISNSALWASTAIFILQDDPQGCDDHVDESRSFLIVASPYGKHGGYVSHTNGDFLSVFAMIERILDIPPMARPDAAATPIWDLFQPEPDLTPFSALPRYDARRAALTEDEGPPFGADLSRRLDFSGPDRNPELAPLLDAYMLWRMGRLTRAEAEARLMAPYMGWDEEDWEELEEEAEEETHAFDRDWARYEAWAEAQGLPKPTRPGR